MTARPSIFISAVTRELQSARQLVATTLTAMGYQPEWQDIFGTEQGDLREMLRRRMEHCDGVIQLIGHCSGAEPPAPDAQFGRVSYTQYEALHARAVGKKVWSLLLDEHFPADPHEPEPDALRELQAKYRADITSGQHLYHRVADLTTLDLRVHKMSDQLAELRRASAEWQAGINAKLDAVLKAVAHEIPQAIAQERQQGEKEDEDAVRARLCSAGKEIRAALRHTCPGAARIRR